MSEISVLSVPAPFNICPEDLARAHQAVPVDERGFIPLKIYGRKFPKVEPVVTEIGKHAVTVSFEKPFGFMAQERGSTLIVETQITDGIVLSADSINRAKWFVVLETGGLLTESDLDLFSKGINRYVTSAASRLMLRR
ncbi:MAG TPA: hypothetical protein VLG37_03970 [Candidatus Saccharimonadales bacterium]|nr:hypothetical protein [Candidatus Saccharimonadales bacterium]